jgi:ATP-dependent RNA helicase DDX21
MASFIGVSSIYQTPTLQLYRRTPTTTTTTLLSDNSHFNNVLKAYYNTTQKPFPFGFKQQSQSQSLTLIPSAIATPNSSSSVLSEEAFKGLGALDDYYDNSHPTSSSSSDEEELALTELGLPHRLVESLEKRGITHLFPIQVIFIFYFSMIYGFILILPLP